jgi:hypothetical protein
MASFSSWLKARYDRERWRDALFLTLIFVLSIVMSRPLFRTQLMDAYDIGHSFLKTVCLYQSLASGQFLCRWIPDLWQGYGYPTFLFYTPLFSYLSAGLTFFTNNLVLGLHGALFLALFFSGVTMYFFAKAIWGAAGGCLSALAYLYAPFHILDLYVRGACAEFLSFVFYPLVLYFVRRVYEDRSPFSMAAGALSVAGMCLSHNCMGPLFFFVALAYAFFLFGTDKRRNVGKVALVLAMLLWGIALTAFFFMPAFLEKSYVRLDRILVGNWAIQNHFIHFSELLFSPWKFSYASINGFGTGISFQIGLSHLLLAAGALLLAAKNKKEALSQWRQSLFATGLMLISIFLCLKASYPLWTFLSLDRIMNVPARFLSFVAFAVSFLAGGVLFYSRRAYRPFVFLGVALLLILPNIGHCAPKGFLYAMLDITPKGFREITPSNAREYLFRSTSRDNKEFLPKWAPGTDFLPTVAGKISVVAGKTRVLASRESAGGLRHDYQIQSLSPSTLCFHTFYFPGWTVSIDGAKTDIRPEGRFGFIVFTAPPGDHKIMVRFEETPVRAIADGISLSALLLLPALFVWSGWKRRKQVITPP